MASLTTSTTSSSWLPKKVEGAARRAVLALRRMRAELRDLSQSAVDLRNLAAHEARRSILADPKYADPRRLGRSGFKAYSQGDEDGQLQEIFRRIGVTSRTFLEIGAGSGLENNTVYLLVQGWSGTWFEADEAGVAAIHRTFAEPIAAGRLRVAREFITRDNVGALVQAATGAAGGELDLLGLDIDGNDYHVLAAIEPLRARVIVLEYNAKFPPPARWVMRYRADHAWDGKDYFGASLKSFELLLRDKGYVLVGCSLMGSNAFFVRRDLAGEHFLADATAEAHYEPPRYWMTAAFMAGHPPSYGPAVGIGSE